MQAGWVQAGWVQRGAGWVCAAVCRLGGCGGVQAVTASSATFCRKAACLLTYLLTYLLTVSKASLVSQ